MRWKPDNRAHGGDGGSAYADVIAHTHTIKPKNADTPRHKQYIHAPCRTKLQGSLFFCLPPVNSGAIGWILLGWDIYAALLDGFCWVGVSVVRLFFGFSGGPVGDDIFAGVFEFEGFEFAVKDAASEDDIESIFLGIFEEGGMGFVKGRGFVNGLE